MYIIIVPKWPYYSYIRIIHVYLDNWITYDDVSTRNRYIQLAISTDISHMIKQLIFRQNE